MSPKPQKLKFETERLKDGPVTHEISISAEALNLIDDPEYTFNEPVTGTITAQLVGTTVLLTGVIKTVAASPCARCLTGLRIPLQTTVTLVYMQDERLLDPVRYPELYDDNTFWYDGDAVYPGEQLREMLLLQLPTVPHCELENEDFCPVRGVHIEPMVFGPLDESIIEPEEEPVEGESFSAQMRRLRKDMGS